MPLTRATPFAPSPPVITQDRPAPLPMAGGGPGVRPGGSYVAFDARGKAVMTDAQGNAVGQDGQPTALAYGGVPNGPAAAPASRAIAAAASDYGSVPLNVGGQMLTRDQAENTDGLDHTDYDAAAAKAGLIPSASAAPSYSGDAPVQVPRRGPGTVVAASPAAPRMQAAPPSPVAPQPSTATMPQAAPGSVSGSGVTPDLLRALLKNPATQALGLQLWQRQITDKPEQHVYHAGDYVYDANNRPILAIPDKVAETDAIKNFNYGQANPAFAQFQSDQKSAEKGQIIDVPLPNGQFQKTWITPGQAPSQGVAVGAPYVPKPGTSVTIDQKAESAQEGEYGKVAGQQLGEVMKAGATAPQALQQVAMLRAAAARAGDNLSTGPFGPFALKAKQALGNLVGTEIPGTSEGEVINNIGYGLATQAARAISNRPTQMEFANALSVKPGLSLSPQGMTAVLNIREQDLKDQIALAKLASVRENRTNWPAVVADYYDQHPVMSPFDPGRPLGAEDVQAINGSQQGAASTISSQDAASLPTVSSPAEAAKLRPGTQFRTPDGRVMQR